MKVMHNGDTRTPLGIGLRFYFSSLLRIGMSLSLKKAKSISVLAYLTLNIFYLLCLPPTNLVIKVCVDIVPSSHQNSTTSLYHPDGQKIGTCVVGERKEFVD
jgi:hypothetical protein